ncbi:MAG: Serine/threonine kinase [Labilithrix sp.]|nr:Serine/threonine kinase [Labilithrix sp.]
MLDALSSVMQSSVTIGGRYALAGEIASGGMATVHLARQIGAAGFARIVAVKRLHERYARDPEFVAMFLDEARLVARVHHPNVVQTIDVVGEGGELFLVMEYIHGESLLRVAHHARKTALGFLPVPVSAAILAGVLRGLHEAHEARTETGLPLGIVHRDVSPHNVLVGADGTSRVLDFGVAKASQRMQSTLAGQLKGKLSYMAPEQITNQPVDRRTDVYAAAVCLWEALTGARLHQAATEGAVLHRILRETPAPPSLKNPAVTPALDAVVLRGLARDPAERFSTAREMAEALEAATPLATAAAIADLVSASCHASLEKKRLLITELELRTSSSMGDAAVDLRALAAERAPAPAPSPRRATLASAPSLVAVVALALGLVAYVRFVRPGAREGPASADAPLTQAVTMTSAASLAAPQRCPAGMALVPGGPFFMGSDDDLPDERPAHKVTLRGYCMDVHEVTVAAYRACSDRGDCKRAGTTNRWPGITARDEKLYDPLCNGPADDRSEHPINCVDWPAADRFCKAGGKRLPSEAEWELAARGSDGRKYPWGDEPPSPRRLNACGAECALWGKKHGTTLEALFTGSDPYPTTAPVGSFPEGASRAGIEDLVGNVWEWTADHHAAYEAGDAVDPHGPEQGDGRVLRGGAWNGAHADWIRPSFRFHAEETTRSHGIGFRCVMTP